MNILSTLLKPLLILVSLTCLGSFLKADYASFIGGYPTIPAELRGFNDDGDGDGVSNGLEYFIDGMDPSDPDNYKMPDPEISGGDWQYVIPRRAGVDDVSFWVEYINALAGSGSGLTGGVTVTAAEITAKLIPEAGLEPINDVYLVRLHVDLIDSSTLPTNNPVFDRYGDDMSWSNDLPWGNVVSILDHGGVADGDFSLSTGTDNTAALQAAITALGVNGGTVYFPAGTYYFADNLFLPNNIILRGETPQNADAKTISFNPPTDLVFPKYNWDPAANGGAGTDVDTAFKAIFPGEQSTRAVSAADANHMGFVWLDINRASINLDGADRAPGGGGYSGRVPVGNFTSTHQLAFGVRVNNSAKAMGTEFFNDGVPTGSQELWQRWPWRFNASIRIASEYATISNCRINDLSWASTHDWGRAIGDTLFPLYLDDNFVQPGYKDKDGVTMQKDGLTTFRHSNQYGVSINGLYHFNSWYATEATAPWLYKPGISVRDNFIYNTFGAKMEASGTDLLVAGNVFRGASDKAGYIRPGGDRQLTGNSFTSRSCLMGGRNVKCYDNDVQVYRTFILNADGSGQGYLSNDGENFMIDNTTSVVDGYYVMNNRVVSNIFAYKTKDIQNMHVINNWWYPEAQHSQANVGASIWIEADVNGDPNYTLNNVVVRDNRGISGACTMKGSSGGSGNEFVNNTSDGVSQSFTYTDNPPLDLTIDGNSGFTMNPQPGNP